LFCRSRKKWIGNGRSECHEKTETTTGFTPSRRTDCVRFQVKQARGEKATAQGVVCRFVHVSIVKETAGDVYHWKVLSEATSSIQRRETAV
jgi:hypothetical protein